MEPTEGSTATHESKMKAAIEKAKGGVTKISLKENIEDAKGTFNFPCGLIIDGKRFTSFSILPLTGGTRKRVTSPDVRKSGVKAITVLLLDCLKQIEGVDKITEKVVNSLTASDRDFASLMIRKESLGNEMRMNIKCPDCKEKLDLDIDIEKLDYIPYDEELISVEDGNFIITVGSKELDYTARFRIANGNDQEKLTNLMQRNPIEAGLKLFQRCLIEFNCSKEFKDDLVEKLDVKILDNIDSELGKIIPGVSLFPIIECDECGQKVKISMDVADFLFKRSAGI